MASVRCHAAIVNGDIVRNAIVRYDADILPGDAGIIISVNECSVVSMGHEEHSTVSFNGVAVISEKEIRFIPISEYMKP
ncbi:MAG: hypothetical protein NC349_07710 [Paenibacillus sp.]|nr:hypothetical protein [Paenibacillus sp.]